MRTVKVMDLFCGTGAFSAGLEKASNSEVTYKVVFGIDLLTVSIDTFKMNHKNAVALAQDIRTLSPRKVADLIAIQRGGIDIILGGTPCQGFSSIRPFRSSSKDDPRNSLFQNFADFVDFFRPKVFILENVVGLATHSSGKTIQAMEECFFDIGYEVDWKVINAAHFGVPQRRERLFLIGVEKGGKIIFPNPSHWSNHSTIGYKDKKRMLLPEQPTLFNRALLLPAVTVWEAIGDLPQIGSGEQALKYDKDPITLYQKERRKDSDILTLHYSTAHTTRMLEIIKYSGTNIGSIPSHLITSGFSSCYSRLNSDQPSVTITVNFVHPASNRCIHPFCDRALTPREGARLQSFDDDFMFAGNKTQIVKQIGNAVPPLLGRVWGESLSNILN